MLRHLPNAICLARIALTVPSVLAIDRGEHGLALGLFAVAAISDGLDGYLAKRNGWTSALGRFLDPLADKLLLVSVFLACAWNGLLPVWLAAAAIARDLLIGGGALVYRLWFGPVNGHPIVLSKVNTALQIAVVVVALLAASVGWPPAWLQQSLAVAMLATTAASGAAYVTIFFRRAWTILGSAAAR
ncbi:MAG: CDP-alcohol phosphatidyltransferase family protein [Gammaproteobacteria bacterium]|nr:CDP-alcohol phosphatidyltransferase family protein [Gammaproteobacteria bacterium]